MKILKKIFDSVGPFDSWSNRRVIVFATILFALLLLVGLPLLMQTAPFQWWGLAPSNELGSTLGGLAAPFLTFISIILIFLTFRAQRKANEHQQRANKDQRIANNEQAKANRQMLLSMESDRDLTLMSQLYRDVRDEFTALRYGESNKGRIALRVMHTHLQNIADMRSPEALLDQKNEWQNQEIARGHLFLLSLAMNQLLDSTDYPLLFGDSAKPIYRVRAVEFYKQHLKPEWQAIMNALIELGIGDVLNPV